MCHSKDMIEASKLKYELGLCDFDHVSLLCLDMFDPCDHTFQRYDEGRGPQNQKDYVLLTTPV